MAMLVLHCAQVRRRMQEGLRQCAPGSVGRDVSAARWTLSMVGNLLVTLLTAALLYGGYHILVTRLRYSVLTVATGFTGVTTAITAALYVYYVYIVDQGNGNGGSTKPKRS